MNNTVINKGKNYLLQYRHIKRATPAVFLLSTIRRKLKIMPGTLPTSASEGDGYVQSPCTYFRARIFVVSVSLLPLFVFIAISSNLSGDLNLGVGLGVGVWCWTWCWSWFRTEIGDHIPISTGIIPIRVDHPWSDAPIIHYPYS